MTLISDPLPLIHALIDAVLLLEDSGDDEIDPDLAVRGLEHISASVLQLDTRDQRELRLELARIANESDDEAFSRLVRAMPDMMGLSN